MVDPRVAALANLHGELARRPHYRSKVETHPDNTKAYLGFVIAFGYASCGRGDLAAELTRASLPNDAIHDWLAEAFGARAAQALAGLPPSTPLPRPLLQQLARFDRFDRYKVDRLRESSGILERSRRIDAVSATARRIQDARGRAFESLLEAGTTTAGLARILAGTTTAEEELVAGVLDEVIGLEAAEALPIATAAIDRIRATLPVYRAALFARALVAAAHFGWRDRFTALLEGVVANTAQAHGLDWAIYQARRVVPHGELERFLTVLAKIELEQPHARIVLGDFELGRAMLREPQTANARLEIIRALTRGYTSLAVDDRLPRIAELIPGLDRIGDSFGTQSHFPLSVVAFADALVLAIVG